jgi:hypothetical protein
VRGGYIRNINSDTHGFSRRNYNSFSSFLNYNIICYKYNNYGHISKFYRSDFRENKKEEAPTIMERN